MRAVLVAVLLAGCSIGQDDVTALPDFDATAPFDAATFGDVTAPEAGTDAKTFNGGGPFLCDKACLCDGTLYACTYETLPDGGCPQGGGPPVPPHPRAPLLDAGPDDAAADAATTACDLDAGPCRQLPAACLPLPTCDCLSKVTGMLCDVDPSGDGFILSCPPPPP